MFKIIHLLLHLGTQVVVTITLVMAMETAVAVAVMVLVELPPLATTLVVPQQHFITYL